MKIRVTACLAVAAGFVLPAPHSAYALLMRSSTVTDLTTDTSTSTTLLDGGLGDTSSGVNGIITTENGTRPNGLTVNGSSQTSIGTPVNPGQPNILSAGASSVVNDTADSINIISTVSANDFTPTSLEALTTGSGTFVSAPGGTITLRYWDDAANTQGANSVFDTPGDLIDTYSFTTDSGNQSFSHNSGPFTVSDTGPYSMTIQFDYTLPAGGSLVSRGQAEIAPSASVSEPRSVLTFGTGVLGFIIITWPKRKRTNLVATI